MLNTKCRRPHLLHARPHHCRADRMRANMWRSLIPPVFLGVGPRLARTAVLRMRGDVVEPQSICTAASSFQFSPNCAILLPGRDCGMPYAPDDLFSAYHSQLDSRFHSFTRSSQFLPVHPYCAAAPAAYACAALGLGLHRRQFDGVGCSGCCVGFWVGVGVGFGCWVGCADGC